MTKVNFFQYKIFSLKSIVRLNWSADWGRFNKKIERSYSEMHTHFNRGRKFSELSKNFFGFLELLSVIFYPKWRAIQSNKNYKAFLGEFPIILKWFEQNRKDNSRLPEDAPFALNEGYRFEFDKGGNSFPLNNFYSIVNELYLLLPDAAQSEMNNFEDHI